VEAAFHTEIHAYRVNGELHRANASEPEIPAAFLAVVGGLASLHDFGAKPLHARVAVEPEPGFTTGGAHYLAPADFATIYDLGPLYGSGTDGTGQSIAIVGRSNILLSDVAAFRSQLGLPANNPTVIVNGTDPGVVSSAEQGEATLDVEWAGAVARNAVVKFVVSASTNSSDGVGLSSQYIVNHNVAPVLSLSFGDCEQAMGTAGNQFWNALWQQAAAQGISVFVAAGDSGAAGCDSPSGSTATGGPAVNGLCSSPYSTCVGGTQFNDTGSPALYWSSNNGASTWASAVSYIPETAWNESSTVPGGSGLWAGGGGASVIYTKPSWQAGTGVPAANHRYVPDVSLTSAGHDGYLVYLNGQFYAFAGTSASTPSFAGLVALAVQRGNRKGTSTPLSTRWPRVRRAAARRSFTTRQRGIIRSTG
jgi:subtilase family serine protease